MGGLLDKVFNIKDVISSVGENANEIIDNLHTSEEEKLAAKYELNKLLYGVYESAFNAKKDVLIADAQSDNWLLESWRPLTILSLVGMYVLILFTNHIIAPIMGYFGLQTIVLSMPTDLPSIVKIILTTFTIGKSAEIFAGRLSPNHNSDNKEMFK